LTLEAANPVNEPLTKLTVQLVWKKIRNLSKLCADLTSVWPKMPEESFFYF
jgi:hypothetical protein